MINYFHLFYKALLALGVICGISACETITVKEMLPEKSFSTPIAYSVSKPKVYGKQLKYIESLINSSVEELTIDYFKQVKLFKSIEEKGDYWLSVDVEEFDKTLSGFGMFAAVTITYRITNANTNNFVFQKRIRTSCKKGASDYLSSITRARKVVACAFHKNLDKLFYALEKQKRHIADQTYSLDNKTAKILAMEEPEGIHDYDNMYEKNCRHLSSGSDFDKSLWPQCPPSSRLTLCYKKSIERICYHKNFFRTRNQIVIKGKNESCRAYVKDKLYGSRYIYGEKKGLLITKKDRDRFAEQACENIK